MFLPPADIRDSRTGLTYEAWSKQAMIPNPVFDTEEVIAEKRRLQTSCNSSSIQCWMRCMENTCSAGQTAVCWNNATQTACPIDKKMRPECSVGCLGSSGSTTKAPRSAATSNVVTKAVAAMELMPDYEVYGIELGVGSGLEEDEWEGCENPEFRVYHVLNGTACHVDVFQQLQSTDPEEPCQACPGYLDGEVTVCRYPEGEVCGLRDDFLPMTWDHLSWADCKVPRRPSHTLEPQVGGALEFRNFKSVPGNYKYGEQILVVGRPVDAMGKDIIALSQDDEETVAPDITEPPVVPVTLPKVKSDDDRAQSYEKTFMSYSGALEAHRWSESFILIILLGALCSFFLIWLFCNYRHRAATGSSNHRAGDDVENRVLIE
ncbi:hypothetical protein FOZ60_017210 [Perkinsus olseni]|uniref:Uncharacterized protein n=1 Tax=Perkinsus olseni TaxID=32597 RepID=A0A7J6P3D1_PEROL|nr:hypothetical protein FOZ60_017210 [Perkinsus olseni]